MPKDKRLYMTFPNDFHRHPKIRRLPVEIRWTFLEMNGEARIADNDGIFTIEEAEFEWPVEHLEALVNSHPSRPLVTRHNGEYHIREYAEHQETRASREERQARNAANGAKGGRPRKNPTKTHSVTGGFPFGTEPQPTETQRKAESESESEDYYSPSESQSLDTRARVSTDAINVPDMTRRLAAQKGITSLRIVVDAIGSHAGVKVDANQAFQVCLWLLEKAKRYPDAPQRYVLSCIQQSPMEVQKHIHEAVA